MNTNYLDFEAPIYELQTKINELQNWAQDADIDVSDKIEALEKKKNAKLEQIFSKLTSWEITQLARHPLRPYTLDYINLICEDFQELHGDRAYADDAAIVGGLARIEGRTVMVIGHQKGRDTKEKIRRNFGMPRPEGYRKALRLMKLAERFNVPIITFIDTPGAYPGIGAEERGQSEAIARNLLEMSKLRVPIICTVTGEGGSGGALAIAVGDKVMMLQYSIYSVISPEGCASILWKSAEKNKEAAEAMGVTAEKNREAKLIDEIIEEPQGGAHRNYKEMSDNIKKEILEALDQLSQLSVEELLAQRYDKIMAYGQYKEK
ncbi:acetyl-coenzyme A carboxylase carboxyl transferase subunit alpha [Ignatzschineria indica]|uniref:Acetyl-coenzyme A carboxylase carboxyl transferase subunit alpha n=1 Tax=Ignatzschineria indica TaxID=472583 RepID=A0A2U2APF0_9GAMM|nr:MULTISPECIES: acetyl-CoA carboxylase carboxyl transferase subunit alpha [Ignatzschineria]MDM1544328.1 acetyl-CoA carboxylase carboxyl transferase subunit alpha [Ignatzschineria indica]OYQ78188.1 acetyl-CoA carboxylase carboxyl transferase subunit alpha [Ignatzschineria sp. F8392]PWD85082.1 acetyl-CoA carboxylase carboxyl transferase subunit alpha [Ignatzschineria indica]GGZ73727.1 acetyl-coenzyme A carboxylase carboxyl transferase subunit alpha [Ignatzschineria indica]